MKICSDCNIKKAESDFYRNCTRRDGFEYICKVCKNNKYYYSVGGREINKRATAKYRSSERGQEKMSKIRKIYASSERGKLIKKMGVRRRRELKKNIDMNYSSSDERITRILFSHMCFKCHSKDDLQIDHHYPLSKGFGLSIDNAVLLCGSCNNIKNDSPPESFYSTFELEQVNYMLALASI